MGGLYDTPSAVFVDDYRIMFPGGEAIGDINASTLVSVFQTTLRTPMGDRDETRRCLLAHVISFDVDKVAGFPLNSINLYFLYDESDPDYVGEIDDAKFFMAEYSFDADENAMAELEKKLDYLYPNCKKVDVYQYGMSSMSQSTRLKYGPIGTAWVSLTGGVELMLVVDSPKITYWHDYTASETASDTTGL